jgi:hypothetical protein
MRLWYQLLSPSEASEPAIFARMSKMSNSRPLGRKPCRNSEPMPRIPVQMRRLRFRLRRREVSRIQ